MKAAPWSARWGFGAAQLKEQLVIMGHLDEDNNVVGFRGLRMLMWSEHPRLVSITNDENIEFYLCGRYVTVKHPRFSLKLLTEG